LAKKLFKIRKKMKKMCIIGLGLIGGSMAIDLRKRKFTNHIIGVDNNKLHAETAEKIGIVDEIMSLEDGIQAADVVLLAVPVSAALELLPRVLDVVTDQVVTDVCSTKETIVQLIEDHPKRSRFIGSHPMSGTENSGPWAAIPRLFDGKVAILCDSENSDKDVCDTIEKMYTVLNMRLEYMNSATHDVHVAYVSHISHICSYALAVTVLDKEKDEQQIFNLASGGFNSTARLAKSGAEMWTPIFTNNKENVLEVMDTFIEKILTIRRCIKNGRTEELTEFIEEANKIRRVLSK
jgi:prephenate dehydrogenase